MSARHSIRRSFSSPLPFTFSKPSPSDPLLPHPSNASSTPPFSFTFNSPFAIKNKSKMPISITPTSSTTAAWRGQTSAPLMLNLAAATILIPVTLFNLGWAIQRSDDWEDPAHKGLRGRTEFQWGILEAYLIPALVPPFLVAALVCTSIHLFAYRTLTPRLTILASLGVVCVWAAGLARNFHLLTAADWNQARFSRSINDDATGHVFWFAFVFGVVGIINYLVLIVKAGMALRKGKDEGSIRVEEEGEVSQRSVRK